MPTEVAQEPRKFDSAEFRAVLGRFCSGVTVVTSLSEQGPIGLTCQGFHSLSLDPPLIVLLPSRSSTTWPQIARNGSFCVNVLGGDQARVSDAFAVSGSDKFAGVDWSVSSGGSPVLPDAAAWIDCTVDAVHEGGDHWIVVGAVRSLGAHVDRDPLLFYRGKYARLLSSPAPQPLRDSA